MEALPACVAGGNVAERPYSRYSGRLISSAMQGTTDIAAEMRGGKLMAEIAVTPPKCGEDLGTDASVLGRQGRCRQCGEVFPVKLQSDAAAVADEPSQPASAPREGQDACENRSLPAVERSELCPM